jgi:hypothetical protein
LSRVFVGFAPRQSAFRQDASFERREADERDI